MSNGTTSVEFRDVSSRISSLPETWALLPAQLQFGREGKSSMFIKKEISRKQGEGYSGIKRL